MRIGAFYKRGKHLGAVTGSLVRTVPTKRGFFASLLAVAGAVAAAAVSGLRPRVPRDRGYRRVARWNHPEGKGLFIAVEPEPSMDELRTLGRSLRQEFLDRENVVVMIFDDARAAREVSRGSRVIGEKRFRAALAHQRAMFLKNVERREHNFTIYASYPVGREVTRY
ncbi:MAG: hypothetical protein ACE5I9_10325 [Candidatus Methylomirabilales bacterium]